MASAYSDDDLAAAYQSAVDSNDTEAIAGLGAEIKRRQGGTSPAATKPAATTPAVPVDATGRAIQPTAGDNSNTVVGKLGQTATNKAPTFPRGGAVGNVNPRPQPSPEIQAELDKLNPAQRLAAYASSALGGGISNLTGGYADKGDAYINSLIKGTSYADELAKSRQNVENMHAISGGADVPVGAGMAMLIPGLNVGRFVPAVADASRALEAMPGWTGSLARTGVSAAKGGATGAAYGALNAGGHDEPVVPGMVSGALWGSGIGGVVPALTTGVGAAGEALLRAAGQRRPSILPDTADLAAQADAAYQALRNAGHSWTRQEVDNALAAARATPRMQAATAVDPVTGAYSGAYPGTFRANTDINNQLAQLAAQGRTTVDFGTLDRIQRNTRAQAEAPPGVGDTGPDQPYRDITQRLDAVAQRPTTVGADITPELAQAKMAFRHSENSALIDRFNQSRDPSELQRELNNNPQFYSQPEQDAMRALIAAQGQGPGWFTRFTRTVLPQVGHAVGQYGARAMGFDGITPYIAGATTGALTQGVTNDLTSGAATRRLMQQSDATRRVLTGQPPPPGTPFSDAINRATFRDRLTRAMLTGALPEQDRDWQ